MQTEEKEFQALYAKFLAWKTTQVNQQDGHEYERSFVAFCRELNKDLFLLATKPVAKTPKKKS